MAAIASSADQLIDRKRADYSSYEASGAARAVAFAVGLVFSFLGTRWLAAKIRQRRYFHGNPFAFCYPAQRFAAACAMRAEVLRRALAAGSVGLVHAQEASQVWQELIRYRVCLTCYLGQTKSVLDGLPKVKVPVQSCQTSDL